MSRPKRTEGAVLSRQPAGGTIGSIPGYVDIHSHLLPGIDDGPPDLEGALAMARAAATSGTATLAATPHLRPDFPDVRLGELATRCGEMRAALTDAGIDLRLMSGAEASLAWALEATDEELRLASYDQRGTDLLIETPPGPTAGLDRLLYQLRAKGLRITLAHPERSAEFQRDYSRLGELVRQGILLQLNAGSLVGSGGAGTRRLARRLCVDGFAHALSSDGHRAGSWRPVTVLDQAAAAAAALVGPERAEWLTTVAPAAILAGVALPDPPPVLARRRRVRVFGRR